MAATRRQKAGFAARSPAACADRGSAHDQREGVKTDGKGNAVAYIDRIGKGKAGHASASARRVSSASPTAI
jgi:hypothetical protein